MPFVVGLRVGLWRKHDGEFSLAKNRKERVACRLKEGGLKNQTCKIKLHRAACFWKGTETFLKGLLLTKKNQPKIQIF